MTSPSTPIYLRKVELSNFRAYGDSFTLEMPEGPGVTLVCGSNGLGKTTLFDGIEWCLTGTISRFSPYVGARKKALGHLTRFGAPEGSHRVSLYFSEGEPIDRGQGLDPDGATIAIRLKRASWPEVGDLGRYLSITHFLGQSAAQRFSVKQPKEQWEALQGPAGVDQIDQLKDRIGGNATRMAFTRFIKSATARVERAKEMLADWARLSERLERLRRLGLSSSAVPPAIVRETCVSIVRSLEGIRGGVTADPIGSGESPEIALAGARAIAGAIRRVLSDAQQKQLVAASILEDLKTVRAERSTVVELAADAEQRRSEAREAELRSAGALADALLVLERAKQDVSSADATQSAFALVAEATQALGRALARTVDIDEQLVGIEQAVSALRSQRRSAMESLAQNEQRVHQGNSIRSRVARLQAAALDVRELETIVPAAIQDELLRVLSQLADTQRRKEMLQERADVVARDAQSITDQLIALDRRNGVIVAAVAQIAAVLEKVDTTCPICHTRFAAGELVALAAIAKSDTLAGSARELSEELASVRSVATEIAIELANLQTEESSLLSRRAFLESRKERRLELEQQLAQVAGGHSLASLAELEARVLEAERELEAVAMTLAESPTIEELQAIVAEVDAAERAGTARAADLRGERARLSTEIDQSRATLDQYPSLWSESGGAAIPLDRARADSATACAAAAVAHSAALDNVGRQRAENEAARRVSLEVGGLLGSYRERESALAARERELLDSWMSLEVAGGTEASTLWREKDALQRDERVVSEVENQLHQIAEGYRAWLADEERAACEREVSDFMERIGAEFEADVTDRLQQELVEANLLLERATRARQRAEEVTAGLRLGADAFSKGVLQPLNAIISEFAAILMTRADGSLSYRAEHHANRSEFKPGFVRTAADGSAVEMDMNPNLFFSEGQLSALSVSGLLAASTTFRWSRWPALLMDDPLQHNDVIHASAFLDLLSRLVRDAGYQVLLSTHDAAEADYIGRKCQSAGLSLRRFDLPIRTRQGIVSPLGG